MNPLPRAEAALSWLYNHLGDPRTKNIIIMALAVLTAFGMIAPTTATSLRDATLSMVLGQ